MPSDEILNSKIRIDSIYVGHIRADLYASVKILTCIREVLSSNFCQCQILKTHAGLQERNMNMKVKQNKVRKEEGEICLEGLRKAMDILIQARYWLGWGPYLPN